MPKPPDKDRTWHYSIDAEGELHHEGTVLDDPALLKFFMEKMTRLPDGRYHVLCQGEDCYITALDVPYVVRDLNITPEAIELVFPGGYREALDPKTLWVGKENVLYCKIRKGEFIARFNRKSYVQLAREVRFDPKARTYYIHLKGRKYPIQGVRPEKE